MPHQCVRCNTMYDDGATEIMNGCSCGGKLFFYIKKSKLEKAKQTVEKLTDKDKKQIEEDVFEIIGDREDKEAPVVLDIESIHIAKPGKFELDLVNLFNKDKPLIYKLEEGKYMIDIPSTLQMKKEKKKED